MGELCREQSRWTTIADRVLDVAAAAIVNPRPRVKGRDTTKTATQRALDRASGTWGGYQAAPPRR